MIGGGGGGTRVVSDSVIDAVDAGDDDYPLAERGTTVVKGLIHCLGLLSPGACL